MYSFDDYGARFGPVLFPEDEARDAFFFKVKHYAAPDPNEEGPQGRNYLIDYIRMWVNDGNGVMATGGSYKTLLLVVTRIIDAWVRDPDVMHDPPSEGEDAVKRVLKGVFHPDAPHGGFPSEFEYDHMKFHMFQNHEYCQSH